MPPTQHVVKVSARAGRKNTSLNHRSADVVEFNLFAMGMFPSDEQHFLKRGYGDARYRLGVNAPIGKRGEKKHLSPCQE